MKKIIITYSIFIYLICLLLHIANLLLLSFNFDNFFFFIYSFISLTAIYFINIKKYVKQSLMFLGITNLVQAISISVLGLSYKFLLGPDFSLYLINSGDKIIEVSLKIYNIIFYVNRIEGDNTLFLGVNFIHFFLFIYFVFSHSWRER